MSITLTRFGKVFLFISTILVNTSLFAQGEGGPTTIPIPQIEDGQEMLILTVNYEPGQTSQPHRHNAHVFVYVLSGTIEMQVRGGPLMRLGPGDTFYENPDDIHQVGRNASSTEPASFLVHMLKKEGAPTTTPVND